MTDFNLISICGEDLAPYFKGIDFESFVSLQPDQVEKIIPNAIHCVMFQNRFNKFLKTISQNGVSSNTPVMIPISFNEKGNADYDEISIPIFDENFDLINVASSSDEVSEPAPGSEKQLKKQTTIKTVQDILDIPNIELKVVIKKNIGKKTPMPNNERTIIGKAVIHHLLVNNLERALGRPDFTSLAELIVQIFPFEGMGTFYTPAITGLQAGGKLVSAYQNYKTLLREAGLIKKVERTSEKREELETDKAQLAQKSDALKLVLENNDDFEQIKIAWQLCFNERQKFLKELTVFEYMHRFPAFDLLTGYELLILDANKMHPNKNSKLPEIAPKILTYASRESKKKKSALELRNLILEFDEFTVDIDEESIEFKTLQQLTALRLLPHLMPNPVRKLSKSGVANLFCPYFKTALAADDYNKQFKKDHKNTAVVLKPRLYFVGALPNPCAKLSLGNNSFTIENTITGFEILLKSFLALKCEYPDQTKHIWQFIQEEVYDIDTGNVKQHASVQTFIKDLKYYINIINS